PTCEPPEPELRRTALFLGRDSPRLVGPASFTGVALMLFALPLLCFVFVFALLRCWRPTDTDIRATLLSASVVWAVLLVIITEFLSLPNALSRTTLACSWAATMLVAGLLVALHLRRSKGLTGWTLARPSLAAMTMALPI